MSSHVVGVCPQSRHAGKPSSLRTSLRTEENLVLHSLLKPSPASELFNHFTDSLVGRQCNLLNSSTGRDQFVNFTHSVEESRGTGGGEIVHQADAVPYLSPNDTLNPFSLP